MDPNNSTLTLATDSAARVGEYGAEALFYKH